MTDMQWLKMHLTNPSKDDAYFFLERVGMILDCGEFLHPYEKIESARQQALKELKAHEF
jgi:hypothetical protein